MSLSSITVSGTLKKDPEKRSTPSNIPVTHLIVEISYLPRSSQSSQALISSQIVRVSAWRDLAEESERKLKAGDKILIFGRAQINAYTNNEGKKKREIEIDATSITKINDLLEIKSLIKEHNDEESLQVKSNGHGRGQGQGQMQEIATIDDIVQSSEEIPF